MAEQLPRGLLADPAVQRAMLLPVARRTYTDPGDDITEEQALELAMPGLLYDPMMGMAQTGAMLMGRMPVDPNVMTQTMLDAPLVGGLLGAATGAVPEGAVLGAFSGRGKGSGAAHARPLNPTNRSLKGINDSPDDNQPPKENFSAVENIYNLYFYNQNIPPKTAEKIKAVIQKHTATNDINTAERAMLGPALDEIKSLQSAAKSKAKKPRWPSKIDLTTIDGVASALKQKLGGGVISGKPYNSRYFDVGENSRLRISDHLAATRRSANNSGEVIVSYGSKGINFDVGGDSLTIPYNDKRLSNRDGLQELIDLIQGSDSIELGANKSSTAALPSLLQDRSGNIDQRSLLSRTPRKRDEFPIFGLLGQRLYTATAPDGSI